MLNVLYQRMFSTCAKNSMQKLYLQKFWHTLELANLETLVRPPNKQLDVVHSFSKDIGMDFGLDKCAKCTIKKGKKTKSPDKERGNSSLILKVTPHILI